MKICSVCRKCGDDSVTACSADDGGSLVQARNGDRLPVKGYRLDFRIEPDSPFELYKATHLDSEKSVLIRFIKTEDSGGEVQKELESAAAINHPNLARVYEFGKIFDDEFYAVSEDAAGQNLREFLETNAPLKETHAIKIARQIAEALEELHSKNIIHRAVSPANIYFTNSENNAYEVKLQNYDFGAVVQKTVVKSANGIDAKTEIFRYFSPEQFTGETLDFKSDIYSLAVVFYEMLLASSPYPALNPQAIENYIFNESDTEKLHFDLRALIGYTLHQSLQHKPHLRPPTTNNLARQYRHLELVAAPPDTAVKKQKENQPKPPKKINGYQPVKTEPGEKHFAEEVKNTEPEIKEEIAVQTKPSELEISPAESSFEIVTAEKFSQSIENFEEPVQTEIEKVNVEEFSGEEIETDEVKFITENEFDEIENSSENIHITNQDFVEEIEPESYLSETVEFVEPEFIEDSIEKKSPANGYELNSFGAYSQPRAFGINKIHIYTAGVAALIIFGIVIAVSFSNTRSEETTSDKNPPAIPVSVNAIEKGNPNVEKINQISEKKETEIPDANEAVIETGFERNVQSDSTAGTKKTTPATVEKPAEKKAAQVIKKQTVNNQPIKQPETTAKKIKAEKSKPAINSSAGMTRPRIVTNVKPKD